MRKILRVRIQVEQTSWTALLAAGVIFLPIAIIYFGISWMNASARDPSMSTRVDAATQTAGQRRYYLTRDSFRGGDGALVNKSQAGACTLGYHMASLWEILDPSALKYNPNLGNQNDDSGMGPPSYTPGWIRTGYQMTDTEVIPGKANCSTWEENEGYGTIVNLPPDWDVPDQQDIQYWDAAFRSCQRETQVWCVSDDLDRPGTCSVPKPILCNQVVYESNAGFANHLQHYDCAEGRVESGAEVVYSLTLHEGRLFSVTAKITDITGSLDIFLLSRGGCVNGGCFHGDTFGEEMFTVADMPPGQYFLVVDGIEAASENYRLSISCDTEDIYLPVSFRKE